ncbi:hypothetical protein K227x_40280 [Rubripirellula lacrimiformis]|uniref:Uncharacterized protein n=1 Tax=Rubripirellula lacrimiformis TaxID=1930273 RepID=A0A517NER3_9BACT|nr:hypothetical protein [Rubripirellula lacrimiformis]QDT05627.1 hypothetical protein K227x_40280 [Rubripirellula lacrimiformis]
MAGCRGRAQRDLYYQKIASESRILEDQLYDADYENRILRDRLEQYQREVESARIHVPSTIQPHSHPNELKRSQSIPSASDYAPYPDPTPDSDQDEFGRGLETEDYDLPMFDEGVPVDAGDPMPHEDLDVDRLGTDSPPNRDLPNSSLDAPQPLTDPTDAQPPTGAELVPVPTPDAAAPKAPSDDAGGPNRDPNTDPSSPFRDDAPKIELPAKPDLNRLRLPAPGGPVPPGIQDTKPNPVIPGEILPPPRDGVEELPPGQIILPDSINSKRGVPERLQVHPSLSVAHHTDGKLDGAVIVINAIDGSGRPVDMGQFDIDAELSIAVLDPTRPADEARIGRWDFNPRQVQTLMRNDPVSGLHVPIQWQDERPNGEDVIIHVRLRGEADDMNCEHVLRLADKPPINDWTPRASTLR